MNGGIIVVLSKNEAFLLALGTTTDKSDIRISLNEAKVLKKGEIESVYYIADMEEAKRLYLKYKASYRRRLKTFSDEFINNSLIVRLCGVKGN